jgi:hypothetical protein
VTAAANLASGWLITGLIMEGFPQLSHVATQAGAGYTGDGRGPVAQRRLAPWFLARRLRGAGPELGWAGTGRTVQVRRRQPAAHIAGPPGELLLYLAGRQGAAQVEVNGPAAAVEAVRRARFGL